MEYTYQFPDAAAFLFTLRKYLKTHDQERISVLLAGATCEFTHSGQYGSRWNVIESTVTLNVPLERLDAFTEETCAEIAKAADKVMPRTAGYEVTWVEVGPQLELPVDEEDHPGLNTGSVGSVGARPHDGLRFRSASETKLYDELKKRKVLFFPNPAAVFGGSDLKREPDFLICHNGKWGILEVMGDPYHPASTATRDHSRARLFKKYGVQCIEFFDADRCYNEPEKVVNEFLSLLGQLKS